MKADLDELIKYYLAEKRNGKDFTEIRKELEEKKIKEDTIKLIVRSIDNKIIKEETSKVANLKAKEVIVIGIVLTLIGIFITMGTYSGVIQMGDSFLFAYGPVFGGIAILLIGLNMRRK